MRIHSLQHVAFEDIGSLHQDIQQQGHSLTSTHWYRGDQPPALEDIDVLIVMGGPMNVYEEDSYPWLATEKEFLLSCIHSGKKIIGICLGAQLIACVLGAAVTRNREREIGWFPLTIPSAAAEHPVARILAQCPKVFHWHGDTFALPHQASLLASSEACAHQAFALGDNILGFQFHLETSYQSAQALIEYCGDELDGSTYVQDAQTISQAAQEFIAINRAMSQIWQWLLSR